MIGSAYIRDLDTGQSIRFIHIEDEITDNITPQYDDTPIVGRSSPLKAYNNTGARQIALEVTFCASIHQMDLDAAQPESPQYNPSALNQQMFDTLSQQQRQEFEFPFAYDGGPIKNTPMAVVENIAFMRSLAYPRYPDDMNLMFPPPKVLLSIGSFIKIIGVVTECSVTWMRPWADLLQGIPILARCSFTVEEVVNRPFGSEDVRAGRDLEITNMMTRRR